MNYQGILNKYKGTEGIKVNKITRRVTINGNWKVKEIETNKNIIYIVETDSANTPNEILGIIGQAGGSAGFLYEVKEQISNYENSDVFKHSENKKTPDDWDNLKKFANDSLASENKYFTFLAGN